MTDQKSDVNVSDCCSLIEVDTAEKLLSELASWSPRFGKAAPRAWMFRGQAESEWPLLPSAMRESRQNDLKLLAGPDNPIYGEGRHQIAREKRVLRRFLQTAYSAGLAIPGDFDELFRYLVAEDAELFGYASTSLWQLAALAQHHGLPTRLLDWTYSWRMAVYFAATSACELTQKKRDYRANATIIEADSGEALDDKGKLVVWAINACKLVDFRSSADGLGVGLVIVPRELNANLNAQDGVFSVFLPRSGQVGLATRGFEEIAKSTMPNWTPDDAVRFTLPRRQAKSLLRLVVSEGVSAAKAFPSYDGVAAAVKQEAEWLRMAE